MSSSQKVWSLYFLCTNGDWKYGIVILNDSGLGVSNKIGLFRFTLNGQLFGSMNGKSGIYILYAFLRTVSCGGMNVIIS